MSLTATSELFAANGFALVPDVLPPLECRRLAARIELDKPLSGGSRCLLSQDWCASLAAQLRQHPVLSNLMSADCVAVQCTYFEKSAERNWLVPVHQDLSIPVAERVHDPALHGWSEKEGTLFVQAPAEILSQMLAVRIHLDPCLSIDGALKVVPGSHVKGRLTPEAAIAALNTDTEVTCEAEPGTALVMRPLLLHASSKSTGNSRRRILHFLFGPRRLTHGLRWQLAV